MGAIEDIAADPTANADPGELAKFNALAHRFWDPHGEMRPLHLLNPVRVRFVAERSPGRGPAPGQARGRAQTGGLPGTRVLDVGCGGGLLAEGLAREGAHVTGIDLAPSMIEVARLHAASEGLNIDYRVAGADSLMREPGAFDIVTCMEMLEHVPQPARLVATLAALVRPGGAVFISTLNRSLKSFLMAIVGAEYVLKLLPRGTHEYERLIRPAELARWGRAAGLSLCELQGIELNPLTQGCRLTGDVGVNYLAWLER